MMLSLHRLTLWVHCRSSSRKLGRVVGNRRPKAAIHSRRSISSASGPAAMGVRSENADNWIARQSKGDYSTHDVQSVPAICSLRPSLFAVRQTQCPSYSSGAKAAAWGRAFRRKARQREYSNLDDDIAPSSALMNEASALKFSPPTCPCPATSARLSMPPPQVRLNQMGPCRAQTAGSPVPREAKVGARRPLQALAGIFSGGAADAGAKRRYRLTAGGERGVAGIEQTRLVPYAGRPARMRSGVIGSW